jgi:hypothetical protein
MLRAEKPPRDHCREAGNAKAGTRFHRVKLPPICQNVNVEDAVAVNRKSQIVNRYGLQ